MTPDELAELADYGAALFAPGRGPRVDSPGAAEAWADLMAACGLRSLPAAKGALRAFAVAGRHQGWWDPAGFAASLQAAAADAASEGEQWAEACHLVGEWSAGGVVRAPLPEGVAVEWRAPLSPTAPTLAELKAAGGPRAQLAAAIQAIGLDAIRNRRPQDEGTIRAQFREALREAARGQVRAAVLGEARGALQGPTRADAALALPEGRPR